MRTTILVLLALGLIVLGYAWRASKRITNSDDNIAIAVLALLGGGLLLLDLAIMVIYALWMLFA